MDATFADIRTFVPLSEIVKAAVNDTYEDIDRVESRYTSWAVRGIKKLTRESLKSGKRRTVLNVNKNFNHAILPCDFKEEIFVGILNSCGEKIALNINQNIVNTKFVAEIPCDVECEAHCEDCYSKQLCCDLETTQVINKVTIDTVDYEETITKTLQSNGEYFIISKTPVKNTQTGIIEYITKKSYLTTFDTAECGCIKKTDENVVKIQSYCYDAFCCYCTSCSSGDSDFGGYRIFEENGVIQFDGAMPYDKIYLEYLGMLPKSGNEYLVPEIAKETLVEFVKYKSIANKKGVPDSKIDRWFDNYLRERGNMNKIRGRISIADLIHSALKVPKFDYNGNNCYSVASVLPAATVAPAATTTTTIIQQTGGGVIIPIDRPAIIMITGADMVGGMVYNNTTLAGIPLVIFANPFNRYLQPGEFTLVSTGGFDLTPLGTVYTAADFFIIFPNW